MNAARCILCFRLDLVRMVEMCLNLNGLVLESLPVPSKAIKEVLRDPFRVVRDTTGRDTHNAYMVNPSKAVKKSKQPP